jgi:hypothetical protein
MTAVKIGSQTASDPAAVPFAAEVAAYLDDCTAHRADLDRRYHPTEDGAVKLIHHRCYVSREDDQAAEVQIRAAYRAAVELPAARTPDVARDVSRRTEKSSMLDDRDALKRAALDAAARGWSVFPVTPEAKKPPAFPAHTAERCNGTDPRCRNEHQGWEQRATTDLDRIARAWARAPYNVGIATGPSGLIVLDLDVPKPGEVAPSRWAAPGICDGADVLAALAEEHGQTFPWETFTVRTRRGGWHLYFTQPAGVQLGNTAGKNPNGLGWLVDTRGHGGYVVAPGSVVVSPEGTGRYEVTYDRPAAPLPGWLATLLTVHRPTPPLECHATESGQVTDLDRYAVSALKGEVERVTDAVEGGRNAALNKAAYNLGRLVGAGVLDDDTVTRELYRASTPHFGVGTPPFTPNDALATIRSAIAAGKRKPRSIGEPRKAAA